MFKGTFQRRVIKFSFDCFINNRITWADITACIYTFSCKAIPFRCFLSEPLNTTQNVCYGEWLLDKEVLKIKSSRARF